MARPASLPNHRVTSASIVSRITLSTSLKDRS